MLFPQSLERSPLHPLGPLLEAIRFDVLSLGYLESTVPSLRLPIPIDLLTDHSPLRALAADELHQPLLLSQCPACSQP